MAVTASDRPLPLVLGDSIARDAPWREEVLCLAEGGNHWARQLKNLTRDLGRWDDTEEDEDREKRTRTGSLSWSWSGARPLFCRPVPPAVSGRVSWETYSCSVLGVN